MRRIIQAVFIAVLHPHKYRSTNATDSNGLLSFTDTAGKNHLRRLYRSATLP